MANKFRKILALGLGLLMGAQSMVAFAADTSLPSDVEGLEAFPGDGEVSLSWDASTDDTGVSGYYVYSGLSSVVEDGGSYTFGKKDAGNKVTYTMAGLSNDVTYYFAMTAYDAAGNESEFYSNEASATPEAASSSDTDSPVVSKAEAASSTMIEVDFSEAVVLPSDGASAFSIEASDGTPLMIIDAYVSSDDPSAVFIITNEQIAGAQYILTAGISVQDLVGNTIVSGTSDTAIFTGSSLSKIEDDVPTSDSGDVVAGADFKIDEIESTSVTEIKVKFTQTPASGTGAFVIASADDASQTVEIINVVADANDPMTLVMTTGAMNPGFEYILSTDDQLLNAGGESLASDSREVHFVAKTLSLMDLVAPEDVTNFMNVILNETSVQLTWTASLNSAGDLAKYLVYMSGDGGLTFGAAVEVASNLTSYDVKDLTAGSTYTFKVSAVDANGNKSEGELTTVTLPESGPELLVLVPMSLAGAAWLKRRKKNEEF